MQAMLNNKKLLPNSGGNLLPSRPTKATESRRAPPSQDRPFACPIPTCGGRFHRKFTLHEHMKTHTGEQPHQCPVEGCGKRFSTSGNLARHRKLHSVQKFNCPTPYCSREFTSREKLMRHIKHGWKPDTAPTNAAQRPTDQSDGRTTHAEELSFPEQPQRHFIAQGLPTRMVQYPVVPGAMLVKTPVWSAVPPQEAVAPRPSYNRISDQDVRDLLDCLFVENHAGTLVNNVGGIIRSEPFLRGAFHQ
ncbi:C2H2 type zinc finger protein [Phytophthora infestans]|uniref:C2H2 type zinc finger protein n=1 Tax=Phytophthora infestans TaxID=4787 RepID=A0A833SJK3_PHYIN|nr:C2H2 type zinc finger protein [Phytophthora infestans]